MSEMAVDTMQSAQDIRTQAAAWLERRERMQWSEADQVDFDSWLSQSLAHRTAYWRVKDAWERADRLRALNNPPAEQTAAKRRSAKIFAGIAVAILVAAMAGWAGIVLMHAPHETIYATAVGDHKTVALADGSQIELNTDTSLSVASEVGRSVVSLDKGEAFFEVHHNTHRVFVVMAGDRRVTDLGTKFVMRREANKLVVTVLEGRVRLDGRNKDVPEQTLERGDIAVAEGTVLTLSRQSARQLADTMGWRRGVIVFKHTTLADAAAEFNRYNREKIVVADRDTGRLKIDGTFPATNVRPFVEVAQDVFGLRVDRRGDETLISR